MAAECLEQGNDVLNSRFYNFEHTHWNGIPIGDYSTFNLLKTSWFLFCLEASSTKRKEGQNREFGLSPL
jgi:hypothetical protein